MVQLQEFDDFRYPKRRPWLLLVLLIGAAVILWQKYRGPGEEKAPEVREEVVEEDVRYRPAPRAERRRAPVQDKDVRLLVSEGKSFQQRGQPLEARIRYLEILRRIGRGVLRREIEDRLGRVNAELVLSPQSMPEKVEYIVKSGDYVGKIALKFRTTVELIQKSNKLANANLIKKGDRLWIIQGTFRILVSKKRNELTLFLNDAFFKRYNVGTGQYGKTPVGTFKITQKSTEPVWWRPDGKEVPYGDPENILGTRWMTLRAVGETPDVRGYGIHGTWNEKSIGKAESAGCVRMLNSDVEELFALTPNGAEVEIVE